MKTLEAGRETDMQVARAMGLAEIRLWGPGAWSYLDADDFRRDIPEFSTDWAEAMRLWQHCRDTYGEDAFARALLEPLGVTGQYSEVCTLALVVRGLTPVAVCVAALSLAEGGEKVGQS